MLTIRLRLATLTAVALCACSLLVNVDSNERAKDAGSLMLMDSRAPFEDASDGRSPIVLQDAGDAAATGFCAANPGHTVCDDFDDRTDLGSNWAKDVSDASSVAISGTRFKSAPHGFRAEIGVTMNAPAYIIRRPVNGNSYKVSFDMYIDEATAASGFSFGSLSVDRSSFDFLWYAGRGGEIAESVTAADGGVNTLPAYRFGQPIPLNRWTRIEVELTPSALRASVDGVTVVSNMQPRMPAGQPVVYIGLYASAPQILFFDNVLIDSL
jgi:hypothetical protein